MIKARPNQTAAAQLDRESFSALAVELREMQDAKKDQMALFMERAAGAGVDPAGLRRFVARKRQDEAKRAQREAIDQQCLYLAGEREMPAELPIGCELAQALNCYRRGMTVRQVAEELKVSTGKAGKLRELARMFDVHVHARVDKRKATLPEHDVATGEITETADQSVAPGESEGTPVASRAGSALAAPFSAGPEQGAAQEDDGVLSGRVPRSDEISKSCGGGESRPAETTYSLDCGGGAAREEMPASEEADNRFGGRALDAGGVIPPRREPALSSATGRNGDTAGVAPGPQDESDTWDRVGPIPDPLLRVRT